MSSINPVLTEAPVNSKNPAIKKAMELALNIDQKNRKANGASEATLKEEENNIKNDINHVFGVLNQENEAGKLDPSGIEIFKNLKNALKPANNENAPNVAAPEGNQANEQLGGGTAAAAAAAAAVATPSQANAKQGGGPVKAAVQPNPQPAAAMPAGGLQLTGARPRPGGPQIEMADAGKDEDEAKLSGPGGKQKADKAPKEEFKGGTYDFWENFWKSLMSIGKAVVNPGESLRTIKATGQAAYETATGVAQRIADLPQGLYKHYQGNQMIKQGMANNDPELQKKGEELKGIGITQIMQGLDNVGIKNASDLIKFGKDAYQAYKAGGPGGVQDMVRNRMNDTANARNAPRPAPDAGGGVDADANVEMVANPLHAGADANPANIKVGEAAGDYADLGDVELTQNPIHAGADANPAKANMGEATGKYADLGDVELTQNPLNAPAPQPGGGDALEVDAVSKRPAPPPPGSGGQNIEVDATLVAKADNVNKNSQSMQNSAGESLPLSDVQLPSQTASTTPALDGAKATSPTASALAPVAEVAKEVVSEVGVGFKSAFKLGSGGGSG